ncbi:hypothetical protein LguiA_033117 [Lonicera macranthoides]
MANLNKSIMNTVEQGYSVVLPEKLDTGKWNVYRPARSPLKLVSRFVDHLEIGALLKPSEITNTWVHGFGWMEQLENSARLAIGSGLVNYGISKNLTMPPKPSRKSKKLSQIEDNDELRLSLMQRSMPQAQPQPLVLLTDMSPPPPPPTFEIRDLPPRSSAPDTATAPPVDMTIASATASTTASNASTGTSVARSIHCKDLDLNVSGTSASKKRRGPVIGAKTQQMVRVGGKIVVEYSDEHRGPAIEAIHSLISHDIGSCVRDRVPMLAEIYAELPKDHKQIVYDYLSVRATK